MTLPPYIDEELWDAFCAMRREMGKRAPFTDYAQKLIVRELMRFHDEGYDANSSLRNSVMKGWRGVFPGELRSVTRKQVDPALQKIAEDAKKAVAPSAEVKAQLAALAKQFKGESA